MEGKFINHGCTQLIESCRRMKGEGTTNSLKEMYSQIAEYPIKNIREAGPDNPPEEFVRLCVNLCSKGKAIAKANNIEIGLKASFLCNQAVECFSRGDFPGAADKALDAIDELRYKGVLTV